MDYGLLEYSITKGFKDRYIINFYIDPKLQTFCRFKEGDRISTFYNFETAEGMIFRAPKNLSPHIKKTELPKLNYSSGGKRGKLRAWYDLEDGDYYKFLLLPNDIIGEQVELKINSVSDGSIFFTTNKPKTEEEVFTELLATYSHTGLEKTHLNKVQNIIRDLKNGIKLEEIIKKL